MECVDKKCAKEVAAIARATKRADLEARPLRDRFMSATSSASTKKKLRRELWSIRDRHITPALLQRRNTCMVKGCSSEARESMQLDHATWKKKKVCALAQASGKLIAQKDISPSDYTAFERRLAMHARALLLRADRA